MEDVECCYTWQLQLVFWPVQLSLKVLCSYSCRKIGSWFQVVEDHGEFAVPLPIELLFPPYRNPSL